MVLNKRSLSIYLALGLVILLVFGYWWEWRHWVVLAYDQKAPAWFQSLVQTIYPRFGVEKQRFPLAFFLKKADQVVLRFALVSIAIGIFFLLLQSRASFKQKIHHFWDSSTSTINIGWQLRGFAGLMLLFTWDWYFYLKNLEQARVFYAPILPYRLLHLPFPSAYWLLIFCILFWLANLAIIARVKVFWSSLVSVFFFLLLQGFMYCFHKVDHTYATLTYAALLIPVLAWYYQKSVQKKQNHMVSWPWRLIQVMIALVYLQAAVEKLLIGGIEWLQPQNFRAYLYMHPTTLGNWLSQSDFWCVALPLVALVFQLGFISIIFYPRFKWIFLVVGITFHLNTYLLLGIGWYYSPWMLVYFFLIDWRPKNQQNV
ncbi:hypothetical protein BKI52_05010 [marine bacterium AO1-C]|nr:hypothetical protein BKI52_05010 [marine bacterium AO1-C]